MIIRDLQRLDLDIIIGLQGRIVNIDKNVLDTIGKSKICTEVQYGIESGSQDILNSLNKGLKLDNIKRVCGATKDAGLNTHCYFMVGLPGESIKTSQLTIEMITDLMDQEFVDFVEYRCFVPYPGTPIWRYPEKYGVKLKSEKWERYRTEMPPVYDLKDMTSKDIYKTYIDGLHVIASNYQKKYKTQFGNKISEVGIISALLEGGF